MMTDQDSQNAGVDGLRACPICGGQPKLNGGHGAGAFGVYCRNGHYVQTYGRTRDEAIAVWNMRTVDADVPQQRFDAPLYAHPPQRPSAEPEAYAVMNPTSGGISAPSTGQLYNASAPVVPDEVVEAVARWFAENAALAEKVERLEKANQHWHQQNLAKMKLEPQEVEPFQREERYIVIKRKRLTPAKEDRLREFLHMEEIGIIECAVVESDWPEYETVWAMIERRVTGAA